MTFPTTLREISNPDLISVYAEYRGKRYIAGHAVRYSDAKALACEYRVAYPKACLFMTDKCDSTSIDGGSLELKAAYAE